MALHTMVRMVQHELYWAERPATLGPVKVETPKRAPMSSPTSSRCMKA